MQIFLLVLCNTRRRLASPYLPKGSPFQVAVALQQTLHSVVYHRRRRTMGTWIILGAYDTEPSVEWDGYPDTPNVQIVTEKVQL